MSPNTALTFAAIALLGVACVIAALIAAGREHRRQP